MACRVFPIQVGNGDNYLAGNLRTTSPAGKKALIYVPPMLERRSSASVRWKAKLSLI